ncbi:MAG: ABC transporter permease [Solirubrobacterales bacterium]
MGFTETIRVAVTGLMANKLRAVLTVLGMTIGVASVIILVAVGKGSSKAVSSSIEGLGTNVLLITGQGGANGPGATSSAVSLTVEDAEALNDDLFAPDVAAAAPVMTVSSATLVNESTSYAPSQVIGTTPDYLETRGFDVQSGASFTDAQVEERERVALIGPTVATNLFPGEDPVGSVVQINGVNFQVVGVTAAKGSSGNDDQDDVVIAPYKAIQDTLFGYGSISQIVVQASSREGIDAAEAQVTSILSDRMNSTDPTDPGFSVINQGSIIEASDASNSVFTTLLGAVAAISLLVGGIGVMNIMLVSVTERTREIGIRKAIGARRSDIMAQFITEAVLISIVGGVVGIAVGLIGSQFRIAGVEPSVAGYSVLLAFAAAALSGLFFGTYPASRAARLRPIDALRFE